MFEQTAFIFLAIFLFIYGLIALRNFLYPIAFGLVLAYLSYPLVSWFEIKGIPRILANFIVILGTLAIMAGLKFAIPLGIAAALFNFIPYFGTLLGGLVPLTFAFLVDGDPILAFKVVILFIIIQFIENNILTPNIVGGNVKINPFFIITGLVAASMIWGIPGMLLVVPLLASVRILFKHIDYLSPYAFLLGEEGTEKHSIQMSKFKRIMKRFKNQIKKNKI